MTTTLNIDLGMILTALSMILTALTPLLLLVMGVFARRDAAVKAQQIKGIHTLVNDAMTREKQNRIDDLKTQKLMLEKILLGDETDEMADEHVDMLLAMGKRIRQLEAEVKQRDAVASQVQGFPDEGGT